MYISSQDRNETIQMTNIRQIYVEPTCSPLTGVSWGAKIMFGNPNKLLPCWIARILWKIENHFSRLFEKLHRNNDSIILGYFDSIQEAEKEFEQIAFCKSDFYEISGYRDTEEDPETMQEFLYKFKEGTL